MESKWRVLAGHATLGVIQNVTIWGILNCNDLCFVSVGQNGNISQLYPRWLHQVNFKSTKCACKNLYWSLICTKSYSHNSWYRHRERPLPYLKQLSAEAALLSNWEKTHLKGYKSLIKRWWCALPPALAVPDWLNRCWDLRSLFPAKKNKKNKNKTGWDSSTEQMCHGSGSVLGSLLRNSHGGTLHCFSILTRVRKQEGGKLILNQGASVFKTVLMQTYRNCLSVNSVGIWERRPKHIYEM